MSQTREFLATIITLGFLRPFFNDPRRMGGRR